MPIAHSKAGRFILHEETSVGLCPWREQERDRRAFFPTSTGFREETLILSGKRLQVARLLGRESTAEDNALKVYRIVSADRILGSVVARRVRGESGVIELLLAVGTDGAVVGSRLQRLREPAPAAHEIQSSIWHRAFVGKTSEAPWQLGVDIPNVSAAARPSAVAILDAARTLLVLLAVADSTKIAGEAHR